MERRAERRLVTCLFVDIVGSTDLTLDLERMTDTPRPEPAFVGREPEMDALRSAFARAAAGHATLVVVRGAPGLGKTRLVN